MRLIYTMRVIVPRRFRHETVYITFV
jgi:hypothetical protein